MTLKEKLDGLLQQPDMTARNYEIQWNPDASNSGKFIAKGKNSNKLAIGNIKLSDNGLTIDFHHTTYGVSYLKKAIFDDFSNQPGLVEVVVLQFNIPKTGSTITTKQFIGQLNPGDKVDLRDTVYYFSVNSDSVNCNGWPLRKQFRAEFLRQINTRCENIELPPLPYTVFKLL